MFVSHIRRINLFASRATSSSKSISLAYWCIALALTLTITSSYGQTSYQHRSLDYPGATHTLLHDVNREGVIVGSADYETSVSGFVYAHGNFTELRRPPFGNLKYGFSATGISDSVPLGGPNLIVGTWITDAPPYLGMDMTKGFLLQNGTYTEFAVPGALSTSLLGVSSDATYLVGEAILPPSVPGALTQVGFVYHRATSTFKYIDGRFVVMRGVNRHGKAVGNSFGPSPGERRGFVFDWATETRTTVSVPGYLDRFVRPRAIDDDGKISGSIVDATSDPLSAKGFFGTPGQFNVFEMPGATQTFLLGNTGVGQSVGYYYDPSGKAHGLIVTPCGLQPYGLDTCALQVGDVLLALSESWAGRSGLGYRLVAGTYWVHTAVYIDDGQIAHATGDINKCSFCGDEGIEISTAFISDPDVGLSAGSELVDWAVIRPRADPGVKQAAASYAGRKADVGNRAVDQWDIRPPVPYNAFPAALFRDKNREDMFYCSQLGWKAYQSQGVDLESKSLDFGVVFAMSTLYPNFVNPDSLYWSISKTLFGGVKADLVAQKNGGLGSAIYRTVFRVFSPVDLLLVDSVGRRTGFDTATGQSVIEIPGTTYSGPSSEPEAITLTGLPEGLRLIVTGTGSGQYTLETQALTATGPTGNTVVKLTTAGQVDTFRFVLSEGGVGRLYKLGDVNRDGLLDHLDLTAITHAMNSSSTGPDDLRDLNGDGRIDARDVRMFTQLMRAER